MSDLRNSEKEPITFASGDYPENRHEVSGFSKPCPVDDD